MKIMEEIEREVRFRNVDGVFNVLKSWLKNHRKALESFGDGHDGKHMLCQVCAKILMIDELLEEIEVKKR